MSSEPLLSVRNLKRHYPVTRGLLNREVGRIRAVDGIDFDVSAGETLGIVGESGCGKSTAATTLLRLEDEVTDGEVRFDGEDILEYDREELKRFRRRAQMIFQDPTSSFDPRMSIGESVGEPLRIHGMRDRDRRRQIVENLLERVGLEAGDADRYPHEFSGGQKQRIALARALVVNPELVVADEPVSALDVSVQAEILSLMDGLQEEFGLAILIISHDMGVIQQVCDRVAVMYLGEFVEKGPTEEIFSDPQHPYTRALLSSIPTPDPRQRGEGVELRGDVPSPANPPSGCRFHTRCPEVIQPEGYDMDQEHWRGLMGLREQLQTRQVDLEAVQEFVVAEGHAANEGMVTSEQMEAAIRDEFRLPDSLDDDDAEAVVSEALDSVVEDRDLEAAAERLAEAFATPCEEHKPELMETGAGHVAACHLHDAEFAPADAEQAPADD